MKTSTIEARKAMALMLIAKLGFSTEYAVGVAANHDKAGDWAHAAEWFFLASLMCVNADEGMKAARAGSVAALNAMTQDIANELSANQGNQNVH